jgi:hypothetical protein
MKGKIKDDGNVKKWCGRKEEGKNKKVEKVETYIFSNPANFSSHQISYCLRNSRYTGKGQAMHLQEKVPLYPHISIMSAHKDP